MAPGNLLLNARCRRHHYLGNIYSIVTYHDDGLVSQAAEAWKREGVAAIGWRGYGDLRKNRPTWLRDSAAFARNRKLFLEISKGDVVLAYTKRNRIAYVGTVAS